MTAAKKWSNEEDVALFRAIVSNTLASRSALYTTPELAQWSKNGGDSINKKIQQLLKKLGSNIPGAGGVVEEQVASVGRGKKVATPTGKGEGPSRPRQRKRAKVVKEEVQDSDDY